LLGSLGTAPSNRDLGLTEATRGSNSQAEAPLDLVMGDALSRVELLQPSVDLRKEDEAFDRIIERGIRRQVAQCLEDPLARSFASILEE